MGDLDPSRVIVTETNKVPFKESSMHPGLWDKSTSLRNWPSIIQGWRNWLIKVADKKRPDWTTRNLDQCISLSLSNIKKNEPMLKAACFFWSNSYNAFLFRQGPMSPTLADVHMLTGLNIAGHLNSFAYWYHLQLSSTAPKLEVGPNTLLITKLMVELYLIKSTQPS